VVVRDRRGLVRTGDGVWVLDVWYVFGTSSHGALFVVVVGGAPIRLTFTRIVIIIIIVERI
jgi:hypothetical protein